MDRLLGHRKVQTTARYAHLARDSVKASAARIAESLGADMAGETEPPCPALQPSAAPSQRVFSPRSQRWRLSAPPTLRRGAA